MTFSRRDFAKAGFASLAFLGCSRLAMAKQAYSGTAYRNEVPGYGPLRADKAGFFDLPEGFSYTVISSFGEEMSDGLRGTLDLFVESRDADLLDYGDNLTVAPNGHLIVCEDRAGNKINYLRGVTPEGKIYTIARLNADTELAGVCFSPDGEVMFVNAYSPGKTLAIRGPWRNFVKG